MNPPRIVVPTTWKVLAAYIADETEPPEARLNEATVLARLILEGRAS